MPLVLNSKDLKLGDWLNNPTYAYVGRYHRQAKLKSDWGNPFRVQNGLDREKAVSEFHKYIMNRNDLLLRLPELSNKHLICHCAPLLCHANILCDMANVIRLHINE